LDAADLQTLHKAIMEDVLHGYDVLPSAVHLTASTLAMLAPEVAFVRMNLFSMHLGMDKGVPHLGSLDFLSHDHLATQITLDYSQVETVRKSARESKTARAFVPKLDLCVMNPPFVRSVGGNLLFGSLPDDRGELQKELKKLLLKLPGASATAGLGSVFVALANRRLSEKGRLAFVLPAALVSGEAWGETRSLIADQYHLETVVASHDADRQNFSENTELSEILFIARKLVSGERPGETTYINLWHNPTSIHEALDLAARLVSKKPISIADRDTISIRSDRKKLAEIVSVPAPIKKENWTGALFAQTDLLRTYLSLQKSELRLPGVNDTFTLPLCPLHDLGNLGYDRRDIHDAFTVSTDQYSPYPAFWDHDAKKVTSITQSPNARLIARTEAAEGRPSKDAHQVWEKSGRILLVERVRTNTHRILAVGLNEKVLGNTWWAFNSNDLMEKHEKSLLLWLNSSLSMLIFFGCRVVTQGAWMQMKKPAWLSMSVLDVRTLSALQLEALSKAYNSLANRELLALAKLDDDPTRAAIDKAICSVLDLPDLDKLRELISREPGLSGKPINTALPQEQTSLFPGDNSDSQLLL